MPVSRKNRNNRSMKKSSRSRKISKSKNSKRSRNYKNMKQRGGVGDCKKGKYQFEVNDAVYVIKDGNNGTLSFYKFGEHPAYTDPACTKLYDPTSTTYEKLTSGADIWVTL